MDNVITITSLEAYEQHRAHGAHPLRDVRRFYIDISLRRKLQYMEFGEGRTGRRGIPEANQRFYEYCWATLPHRCEECMRPLHDYSAVFVSHILARGAHPDMAHDPRNVNILCGVHHNQWEFGNRECMRINERNQRTIALLKKEYNEYNSDF